MKFTTIWRQLSIGALCLAAFGTQAEEIRAVAAPEMLNGMAVQPTAIDLAKRQAAQQVARLLADPAFAASLDKQLKVPSQHPGRPKAAALRAVLDDFQQRQPRHMGAILREEGADQKLRQLDTTVLRKKGLVGMSPGLLQVRLYQPKQAFAAAELSPADLSQTLVAFEPAGDDKQWKVVEAYDRNGRVHKLDAKTAPQFPVLVADIDGHEDLRAGLALANKTLAQQGMQLKRPPMAAAGASAGYVDTAKLDRIRVGNDQEPWISGAAEVYAMVSGVQPDQSKAQIELVDMPYLDYDGQTYSPNQILIFWSNYRYAAANVQFFEHDDNTNYKDLVLAVTSGVEKILGVFKPEFAVIATVANAIIQAMPAHWFSNDDDYMDSFYTLEKNRTYTDWAGVGGNVTMTLTPYKLQEQ
ncbi:DUF3103 family protein [Chitinimonas arctica]|uniref:DUF3103 family protein n=1 Tax=Chitinimonas arctica TaxID=2594795 RepID=A0A516SAB5_9NEIS|nr:DUF3103 family protein [Chitinimonas arctica]QDQ25091.1 DUF3103 family protein [Chitinimonas arctica]